ncbi:MAG: D-alanyl-D-alanine carboxypeptidase [Desulfobacteraceae bacterium]|nr:D-alanyl-D-alanine carboxypeptidase [Desulfobacteraceae bacterium]MBC2756931.1 D-alanyl-D-alanine carboxypeptidase [Desulfobacteraceae bacterium]
MNLKYAFKTAGRFLKTFCITSLTVFLFSNAFASDPSLKIKDLITPADAVLLASPGGDIILSVNAEKKLIPASTLKLLTSLIAIHYLKEDYKYPTDFYIDTDSNLIIKGYGDPLLVSEEISEIASTLKPLIVSINDIILDDTFFEKPLSIPGTVKNSIQPYDAPNGALCVNFNTVNFKIENKTMISAEPQTPIVDIARQKIKTLNLKSGRILLTNNGDEITRYAGQIFQYFLQTKGIEVRGGIKLGMVNPLRDKLIYRHMSQYKLTEIIARLLEYSNNFIANQLLLTTGARVFGPPASMEKGVKAAKKYLAERFDLKDSVDLKNPAFVEGSGISRNNRLTAHIFLEILFAFNPYHGLMQHKNNEYYKTGTLNGVNTRAGYLVSQKGELYPFVVFINTPGKTTAPVMKELKKMIH